MKKIGKIYFTHFIKPTMMMTSFYINYQYLKKSEFPNQFYLMIYYFAYFMKPFFFLILYIGLLINSKINSIKGYIITFFITISIFFGFPIKELSDYFDWENLKSFFDGKEYNLYEYLIAHFIVNLLIENIPIVIFVLINNNMLGKWKNTIIDPIVVNVISIFLTLINLYLFFRKENIMTRFII